MKSSALLRQQIETSTSARIASALRPRLQVHIEQMPCGVPALDALLGGGLPVGALTELVGAECSGRTTVALSCLAAMTAQGGVGAWVDAADTLEPESAAASGVDLERLLWVRCGGTPAVPPAAPAAAPAREGMLRSVEAQPGQQPAPVPRATGCGSPHPRSEGKGMPEAVASLMQAPPRPVDAAAKRVKRMIGTPSAPNRPLTGRSVDREEQPNSDRLPPRRGGNLTLAPRCAEPLPRRTAADSSQAAGGGSEAAAFASQERPSGSTPGMSEFATYRKPSWAGVDQALRAADLLLQGGGFTGIVLDLGSIPPEISWRIPMATWFRFRAACERTRTSLLLLTQHACARSSAALALNLEAGGLDAEGRVMTAIRYHAAVGRSRGEENLARVVSIRKPPQPERPGAWRSEAAWAGRRP